MAAILENGVGGQQLGLDDHLGVLGVPGPHQCVLHGSGDLEQSIDVSEFASLDPSLPHGLGLYEVVTVGLVVWGHGEPHEQVEQDKPGDHGAVVQDDVEFAIDQGIPVFVISREYLI